MDLRDPYPGTRPGGVTSREDSSAPTRRNQRDKVSGTRHLHMVANVLEEDERVCG